MRNDAVAVDVAREREREREGKKRAPAVSPPSATFCIGEKQHQKNPQTNRTDRTRRDTYMFVTGRWDEAAPSQRPIDRWFVSSRVAVT